MGVPQQDDVGASLLQRLRGESVHLGSLNLSLHCNRSLFQVCVETEGRSCVCKDRSCVCVCVCVPGVRHHKEREAQADFW